MVKKKAIKSFLVLAAVVLFFSGLAFLMLDAMLARVFGFGNPILYDSNAIYGFRPAPNQNASRFFGSKCHINNLGLRAAADWDNYKENKILFLGDSVTFGGSRLDDDELFSTLAVEPKWGCQSGNAGVNAWGVENICSLLVNDQFNPAKYYVFTLLENDFYRGLVRIQGMPFFNKKPKTAWEEIFLFYAWKFNNRRYGWQSGADKKNYSEMAAENAVRKLKNTIDFLHANNYQTLIFISPTREQVLSNEPKDFFIQSLLAKYDLSVIYIADRIKNMDQKTKNQIFFDHWHLIKQGHRLWAQVIREELEKIIKLK